MTTREVQDIEVRAHTARAQNELRQVSGGLGRVAKSARGLALPFLTGSILGGVLGGSILQLAGSTAAGSAAIDKLRGVFTQVTDDVITGLTPAILGLTTAFSDLPDEARFIVIAAGITAVGLAAQTASLRLGALGIALGIVYTEMNKPGAQDSYFIKFMDDLWERTERALKSLRDLALEIAGFGGEWNPKRVADEILTEASRVTEAQRNSGILDGLDRTLRGQNLPGGYEPGSILAAEREARRRGGDDHPLGGGSTSVTINGDVNGDPQQVAEAVINVIQSSASHREALLRGAPL